MAHAILALNIIIYIPVCLQVILQVPFKHWKWLSQSQLTQPVSRAEVFQSLGHFCDLLWTHSSNSRFFQSLGTFYPALRGNTAMASADIWKE